MKITKTNRYTKEQTIIYIKQARSEIEKEYSHSIIFFPSPISKLMTENYIYELLKEKKQ